MLRTTEEPASSHQLLKPLSIRGLGCRHGGLQPHSLRADAVIHSSQAIARLPRPISHRALFSSASCTSPLSVPLSPFPPSPPVPGPQPLRGIAHSLGVLTVSVGSLPPTQPTGLQPELALGSISLGI